MKFDTPPSRSQAQSYTNNENSEIELQYVPWFSSQMSAVIYLGPVMT